MKILLTRSLLDIDKKFLIDGLVRNGVEDFKIVAPATYDEEGICREVKDTDVLLGSYITERIIKEAVNLKLIQVPWTGMDTFNFAAVKNSTVPICNSHSNAASVAEFGVALLLDLIKKISYHDRKMRHGNWNRDQKPLDLKSGMLSNKIVCILGYGNIGRRIGKLINAFGAKVIAVDNRMGNYDEVFKIYEGVEWLQAIALADICIIALPLTPQTKKLIDSDAIRRMKEGCLIVNISRAEIIDEDDIYRALIENYIGGFASDVWWNVPKRGETKSHVSINNKFEEFDNIVLSPHRAGFVEHALPHLDDVIINISNLFTKRPFINVVNIHERH